MKIYRFSTLVKHYKRILIHISGENPKPGYRLTPRLQELKEDLDKNWAVVAEAIQTVLRRENYPKPYEALKELTRGKNAIDKKSIHQFITGLKVSATIKKELKAITPHNYTGI